MEKGDLKFLAGDDAYCQAWEYKNYLIIGGFFGETKPVSYTVSASSKKATDSSCYCAVDTSGEYCHCVHSKEIIALVSRREALNAIMDSAAHPTTPA